MIFSAISARVGAIRLTDDDLYILREVHHHRTLRTKHIFQLLPKRGSKHLLHRLRGLYDAEYLDRIKEDVRAGENPEVVYALGNRGAEALGIRRSGVNWAEKNGTYGSRQLKHRLLVTDVSVAIRRSSASHEIRLILPKEILENAPELTRKLQRPFQWKVSVSRPRNATMRETVRPDYIFGLEFPNHPRRPGLRRYFMLEADRGTEPQRRSEPRGAYAFRRLESIADKMHLYDLTLKAWQEGKEVAPFGFKNFYVLFVTDRGPPRVVNMVAESKRISGGEGVWSHWFATSTVLKENDFLTMPWQCGTGKTLIIEDFLVKGKEPATN